MGSRTHRAFGIAVTALALAGCGGESSGTGEDLDAGIGDADATDGTTAETAPADGGDPGFEASIDTGAPEVAPDTSLDDADASTDDADATSDTGVDDALDTGIADTFDAGPDDAGAADTGPTDTGPADTGPADTGPADTGPADTGPADTGPADTGPADTGPADTGPADTGTDTFDAAALLPTVTIDLPASSAKIEFNSKTDACQPATFTVSYTAPLGFKQMRWRFVTPSSGTGGSCSGAVAYGYFMDGTTYAGQTSGTFAEVVALGGLYSGPAGNGRWWWCTEPGKTTGTPQTAVVSLSGISSVAPGAPGGAGFQTLSNYCYRKGSPADTETSSQWTLEVDFADAAGNVVTASRKFWIFD